MLRVALVTARAARGLDDDLPPLQTALQSAGAHADICDWDDPSVDWSVYDVALLRSTWDYSMRVAEFFSWAERVSALTTLLNPLPLVRWNMDKHYLCDLARVGVPVVPSVFIEPGESAAEAISAFLREQSEAEIVIKPAISSGSRDAQRHLRAAREDMLAHARRLLDAERSVLLQPYLDRVDTHGETALIYFAGRFSHAIRKGPLLRRGEGSVNALFAQETITARVPELDEQRVGEQARAAIPFDTPLYARVDLIRDAEGAPRVLELELAEPSLFFAHDAGSAERFAAALLARGTFPSASR